MAKHSEVFLGLDVAKTCHADRTAAFRSPGLISRPSARIERASGSIGSQPFQFGLPPPPTGRTAHHRRSWLCEGPAMDLAAFLVAAGRLSVNFPDRHAWHTK